MLLCYNNERQNELDNSLNSIKNEQILEIEELLTEQSKIILLKFNI
jgi:hypothetical protein